MPTPHTTARALGCFSLGLGTAQIVAPGALARLIGLKGGRTSHTLMRLVGVRELAAGAGLLSQSRSPALWLWSRVAGDVLDLALLSAAMADGHTRRPRLAAALAAVGGVTAADVGAAQTLGQAAGPGADGGQQHLLKAITVRRSPEEVYRFWRDFRNFPGFMSHLQSVAVVDERRSHWTAKGPAGRLVEWDAELTEDQPNQRIAWRSLPGPATDIQHSGSVRFAPAPGGRGTEVRVELHYALPAGGVGATLARVFGQEPQQQVQADLRKLKQMLEAGEVVRSAATLAGTQLVQRPAQPPAAHQAAGARP